MHGLESLVLALLTACGPGPQRAESGAVSLALTSQASGVTYRLADARFALKGPESKGFASGNEEQLDMDLAPGTYSLELLEGWHLIRADDASSTPVVARLVSQNPAPLLVEAGTTTQAVFRFELSDGTQLSNGKGQLAVGFSLDSVADAAAGPGACVAGLRINELDYDQPSTDEAEFVEVLNTADCDASLAGVVLELLDGGDGQAYARYDLGSVAEALESGQRLVLGDSSVLAALPAGTPSLLLNGSGLQNGPDGVRLALAGRTLDAVAYEGAVAGLNEGQVKAADEAELALGRCPDGLDTEQNALDFSLLAPTPGEPNECSNAP
jgi:hypothetical protein